MWAIHAVGPTSQLAKVREQYVRHLVPSHGAETGLEPYKTGSLARGSSLAQAEIFSSGSGHAEHTALLRGSPRLKARDTGAAALPVKSRRARGGVTHTVPCSPFPSSAISALIFCLGGSHHARTHVNSAGALCSRQRPADPLFTSPHLTSVAVVVTLFVALAGREFPARAPGSVVWLPRDEEAGRDVSG
jgi:hypothetical protein